MSSPLPTQPEEEYGNEALDEIQENTDSMEEKVEKLQEIEMDTL